MDKLEKENYYKTKKMLNNYLLYKIKIEDLLLDNKMLITDCGVQALQYQESTGKTYKINSSVENTIFINKDKIEKNTQSIEYKQYFIKKIDNAINILDKFEKEVIINKFLTSQTASWKDVSIILNTQAEICRKASDKAITKLANFLS